MRPDQRVFFGTKAPGAMGSNFKQIWEEVADPLLDGMTAVVNSGQTVYTENTTFCPYTLEDSAPQEYIVTWSFIAIPGDNGSIIGLHNVCVDNTEDAFAYRRYEMLRKLGNTTSANSVSEVWKHTITAAETLPLDLPILVLYSVEQSPDNEAQVILKLAGTTGLPDKHPLAIQEIRLDLADETEDSLFPFKQIINTPDQVLQVHNVAEELTRGNTTKGWPDPPRNFAVVAASLTGGLPHSVIVVALNTRAKLLPPYGDFLISIARRLESALLAAESKEADKGALARLETLVQQRTKEVQSHSLRLVDEQKTRAEEAIRARKEDRKSVV